MSDVIRFFFYFFLQKNIRQVIWNNKYLQHTNTCTGFICRSYTL